MKWSWFINWFMDIVFFVAFWGVGWMIIEYLGFEIFALTYFSILMIKPSWKL